MIKPDITTKEADYIITNLKEGDYVVPTFQRDYDWNAKDIIDFTNSLIKNHPFNGIIIWEGDNKSELYEAQNFVLRNFVSNKSNRDQVNFIIDGQQRLTTLFVFKNFHEIYNRFCVSNNSYKADDNLLKGLLSKFKNIYFNMDDECFEIVKNKSIDIKYISLNALSKHNNARSLINQENLLETLISKYDSEDNVYAKVENAVKLFLNLFSSQISVTTLKKCPLAEAIEVFNNMNTKGKPLKIWDILHAKWYDFGINLNNKYEEFVSSLQGEWKKIAKGILSDTFHLFIDDKKIITSAKDQIDLDISILILEQASNILDKTIKSIRLAINFCTENNFSKNSLPSENIIKWLAYFFYHHPKHISVNYKNAILFYIATISTNSWYSSSTSEKLKKDIEYMQLLINGQLEVFFERVKKEIGDVVIDEETFLQEKYTNPSMRSKWYLWLITTFSSDPYTGTKITDMDFTKVDDHHIFPKNMKDKTIFKNKYNPHSLANIWRISKTTNQKASNKKPSEYVVEIVKDKNVLQAVGISEEHLINDDFEGMVKSRSKWFKKSAQKYIRSLMGEMEI